MKKIVIAAVAALFAFAVQAETTAPAAPLASESPELRAAKEACKGDAACIQQAIENSNKSVSSK